MNIIKLSKSVGIIKNLLFIFVLDFHAGAKNVTFPCAWQKNVILLIAEEHDRNIRNSCFRRSGGCPWNVSKCLETEMVNEVDLICLEYIVAMDNPFWTLTFWPTD